MKHNLFSRVALAEDLPARRLQRGDVATVVESRAMRGLNAEAQTELSRRRYGVTNRAGDRVRLDVEGKAAYKARAGQAAIPAARPPRHGGSGAHARSPHARRSWPAVE